MKKIRLILIGLLLFTMACALTDLVNDDTPEPSTSDVRDDDDDEDETPEPRKSGAVDDLTDVKNAVIQIVADGTFISPEGIQSTNSGAGSGFIIDPSGIAVTNNHVVAGAGKLTIYIGGDTSKSYNAQMLGISECSDLAVIDIEGDGFEYLEWYEDDIEPGLDVYAAGFPLGDPEYTLTRGIVSKARADGETDWASVDAVIEHDSTINPGNSGGPLVTEDGQVVGVNYASSPSYNQYFAIAPSEALPVIEKLTEGNNVDSLGINAQAIYTDDGLYGIWAASVQPGSRADKAGIQGGDILLTLQDLELADDGTMSTYCDVIRSHTEDATLNVEVLRFATQEVLAGQINGRMLEQAFSFANEAGDDVQVETSSDQIYSEYMYIYDDYGVIGMEVPVAWDNIDGSPWLDDDGSVLGASLYAEPSQGDYYPFVYFAALPTTPGTFDADDLLNTADFSTDCTSYMGREDYNDPLYTGKYDYYTGCYEDDSVIFVVVAEPEDGTFVTYVIANAVTAADLDAVDNVFATFEVVGELPGADAVDPGGSGTGGSITVVNNASYDVAWLYVASSDADTWGGDRLGDSVLSPGESVTVSGLVPGYYDIRPEDFDEFDMGTMYAVYVEGDITVYVPGTESISSDAVLIMEEYFLDNTNNWYVVQDESTFTLNPPSGGYYCYDIYEEYYNIWSVANDPADPWNSSLIEDDFMVQAYCESSAESTCSLAFLPDQESYDLLMFDVDASYQEYRISRMVDNEWVDDAVGWTYSPYIDPWFGNYVAMHRRDGYLTVFINGVMVDQIDTSQYGPGFMGISGRSLANTDSVNVCYSELAIWRLP